MYNSVFIKSLSQKIFIMAREMKVIMSNAERNRKWRAANPEKVLLAETRRNMHLKKRRESDLQFNLIQREKDRKKKQKYRLAIKARDKAKSEANKDVDPLANKESVDSYTLKNGAGSKGGFFSSLASLATEQVASRNIVLGDISVIKHPAKHGPSISLHHKRSNVML